MKAPPRTADEAYRLDTLRSLRLLDSPPEERFDRLTRIARRALGTPWAMLNLVDDQRLYVKSCSGLDFTEIPREMSFCAHTIHDDDIMIVADARDDERFTDNPYVRQEPGILFYAGCPLSAANGSKVATLCVCDNRPRQFNEDDMTLLRDLANIAERELDAPVAGALDALTGLSDQSGFFHLCRHMLNLCERLERPATLVYFRLGDGLVESPLHGHAEGDRLLMSFADVLLAVSRESDVRGRVDSHEFAVLLANCGQSRVEMILERVQAALAGMPAETAGDNPLLFHAAAVEYDPEKHEDARLLVDEAARKLSEKLHPHRKKRKPPTNPVY